MANNMPSVCGEATVNDLLACPVFAGQVTPLEGTLPNSILAQIKPLGKRSWLPEHLQYLANRDEVTWIQISVAATVRLQSKMLHDILPALRREAPGGLSLVDLTSADKRHPRA